MKRTPLQRKSPLKSSRQLSQKPKTSPRPRQPKKAVKIDKSSLPVMPGVDRKRDAGHLNFIRLRPCAICRCKPSHAHHLTHAQPKARGLKAGDQWTVPLCPEHHQNGPDAVHVAGNERAWWEQWDIDPLALASKLWALSHPS